MKIIVWDIETSPLLVTTWGIFKPYLTIENIVRDGNILTATWKEVGKKQIHSVAINPLDPTDDRELVLTLAEALAEADVIVAHNGNDFDRPWLNSRLAFWNQPPLPPLRSVDTLKVARQNFRFVSNKLDYLARHLGIGRKIKTDYDLWKDVQAGSQRALDKMVRYNKMDVLLLEKVYLKLRPFMLHHPNQSLFLDKRGKCPTCGVGLLEKRGTRLMGSTTRQRYHCLNGECGAWSYGTRMTSRTEVTG